MFFFVTIYNDRDNIFFFCLRIFPISLNEFQCVVLSIPQSIGHIQKTDVGTMNWCGKQSITRLL